MLTVGRLHIVKDHAFLVRACARLQEQGLDFRCQIAGEGPERRRLQCLIRDLGVENSVVLLGHTSPQQTDSLYRLADLVVLTSRSEGIPLVLMEAMARGRLVLAPAITGIPELVLSGKTGFLYEPGSTEDFLEQLTVICRMVGKSLSDPDHAFPRGETNPVLSRRLPHCSAQSVQWIRHAARVQVSQNFNREQNLRFFTDLFLERVGRSESKDLPYASSLLQQI